MARFDYRRVEHLGKCMKITQLSPGIKYMFLSNIFDMEHDRPGGLVEMFIQNLSVHQIPFSYWTWQENQPYLGGWLSWLSQMLKCSCSFPLRVRNFQLDMLPTGSKGYIPPPRPALPPRLAAPGQSASPWSHWPSDLTAPPSPSFEDSKRAGLRGTILNNLQYNINTMYIHYLHIYIWNYMNILYMICSCIYCNIRIIILS